MSTKIFINNSMWTRIHSRIFASNNIIIRTRVNRRPGINYLNPLSSRPDLEVTETPEYPPIPVPCPPEERKMKAWSEKIHEMPTIEEKMLEMTKNPTHIRNADELKYADCRVVPTPPLEEPLKAYRLSGMPISYGTLPAAQYLTRTKLINGLPNEYYDEKFLNIDEFYPSVKPMLEEALITNHEVSVVPWWNKGVPKKEEEKIKSNKIINQIFRVLCNYLSGEFAHLQQCHVDRDPRVESFWLFGGFPPTEQQKEDRKEKMKSENKFEITKTPYIDCYQPPDNNDINKNVEEIIFYKGKPSIQLRTATQLPAVVSIDNILCNPADVPSYRYVPQVCDLKPETQWPVLLPGVWPGNPYEFGHTSFHTIEDLHDRRENVMGTHGEDNALKQYGITSSFGWLMGLAALQGFGPYNELDTPLVCQTVVTNGQRWSFYLYQMNTCHLVSPTENNRCNVCWASDDMKLYDEISNGVMKGLNDDVFKLLIKFLLKKPVGDVLVKENVRKKELVGAEWEEMMAMLWRRYCQRSSKRTRQTYDWERIYLHNDAYLSHNPNRKRKKGKDTY
uniref:28S ribosomal protein S30, mitochondrial n=1 Tax=Strigamia maritima TaxID=126957 RepID=T1J5B9_STRMM